MRRVALPALALAGCAVGARPLTPSSTSRGWPVGVEFGARVGKAWTEYQGGSYEGSAVDIYGRATRRASKGLVAVDAGWTRTSLDGRIGASGVLEGFFAGARYYLPLSRRWSLGLGGGYGSVEQDFASQTGQSIFDRRLGLARFSASPMVNLDFGMGTLVFLCGADVRYEVGEDVRSTALLAMCGYEL